MSKWLALINKQTDERLVNEGGEGKGGEMSWGMKKMEGGGGDSWKRYFF